MPHRGPYNEPVDSPSVRGLAGAAAAALFAFALGWSPARADSGTDLTMPVGPAAVVRMQMQSGTLTVRTWDQPQVHVTSSAPVNAQHFAPPVVRNQLRGGDIPIFETTILAPNGPLKLPPEDFAVNSLSQGEHDGVLVRGGDQNAAVTLTIPNNTALLLAVVGRGQIQVQGYHGGSFVGRIRNGPILADDVSGAAYLEAGRGRIRVSNSTFDRVRARTAVGNVIFEHCTAQQIEVSSINGNVAYDDGTFSPGVARFESQNGNVAIGVGSGGVQIGAHSAGGKIFDGFDRQGSVTGTSTDAQATYGGGGPVVTASTGSGAVYLYNGSRKARRGQGGWHRVGAPAARRPQPGRKIRMP